MARTQEHTYVFEGTHRVAVQDDGADFIVPVVRVHVGAWRLAGDAHLFGRTVEFRVLEDGDAPSGLGGSPHGDELHDQDGQQDSGSRT